MVYRFRIAGGKNHFAGNFIGIDGASHKFTEGDVEMKPTTKSKVGRREVPTEWNVKIPAHEISINIVALNSQSWMGTTIPYWEGPILFRGSHSGVGYLEMTGY